MNTIQINADGTVTISQETLAERVGMSEHYASQEVQTLEVDETTLDETRAHFFKEGWDSAVRETQLRFVNGQLLDFYNEQGTPSYSMDEVSQVDLEHAAKDHEETYGAQDPHYMEPAGTGEDWGSHDEVLEDLDESNFMSVQEWGEVKEAFRDERGVGILPEVKMNPRGSQGPVSTARPSEGIPAEDPDYVEPGTWTLSNEELNSRLNEAYRRGGEDAAINHLTEGGCGDITRRTLLMKAQEVVSKDTLKTFASGRGVPTPFHEAFGESVEGFVVPLAQSLGFKVVD